MTTEEEMTIDERRKYLRKMKQRYIKAKRQERSQLLDEMEAVTGLHRKSLTRLMRGNLERKPRSKERIVPLLSVVERWGHNSFQ